jgi:hypothetical protein
MRSVLRLGVAVFDGDCNGAQLATRGVEPGHSCRRAGEGGGGLRGGAVGRRRRTRATRHAARDNPRAPGWRQAAPATSSPCDGGPGRLLDDRKAAAARVDGGGATLGFNLAAALER